MTQVIAVKTYLDAFIISKMVLEYYLHDKRHHCISRDVYNTINDDVNARVLLKKLIGNPDMCSADD